MIKLITIDLDGTLFDKDKNSHPENIKAIKRARENGVFVVIATGRPFAGTLKVLEKLEMNTINDYIICYNGAKIINVKTKEVISSTYINGEDVKKIHQLAINNNLNVHAFRDNEELITPKINEFTDVEATINNIEERIFDFNLIKDEDMFIKAMIVDKKESLDVLEKNIALTFKTDYSMVRSAKIFLEFLNNKTDKGFALMTLANYLNISMDETMAIGDAGNDLHMIQKASVGVAMANSFPEVLEAADYITLDNNNGGVGAAINKFVFNE